MTAPQAATHPQAPAVSDAVKSIVVTVTVFGYLGALAALCRTKQLARELEVLQADYESHLRFAHPGVAHV
jgi:hypothetical protein